MSCIVTAASTGSVTRRSAAAAVMFCGRVVLFGGIPHESDASGVAPERILAADAFSAAAIVTARSSREAAIAAPPVADADDSMGDQNHHLAACDPPFSFPCVTSRSPAFVWAETDTTDAAGDWRFVPTLHAPWSRHGHFLLVDPISPRAEGVHRCRVAGGRFWHIGDEVPALDACFELRVEGGGEESSAPAARSVTARWRLATPIAALPALYSPAVALVAGDGGDSPHTAVAMIFGGMRANRLASNHLYRVFVAAPEAEHGETRWFAVRVCAGSVGERPRPQFKGALAVHGDACFAFDGFTSDGAGAVAHVNEFNLATSVWRRVCASTPVARAVAIPVGRFVALHGGQRTVPPFDRIATFAVFDVAAGAWVGRRRRAVDVAVGDAASAAAATLPRSAHCAVVCGEASDGVRVMIISGSEERAAQDRAFPELLVLGGGGETGDATQQVGWEALVSSSPAAAPPQPSATPMGNGGSATASVLFCTVVSPVSTLASACASFLAAATRDDLLEDLF
jgi:hypothetical protein